MSLGGAQVAWVDELTELIPGLVVQLVAQGHQCWMCGWLRHVARACPLGLTLSRTMQAPTSGITFFSVINILTINNPCSYRFLLIYWSNYL